MPEYQPLPTNIPATAIPSGEKVLLPEGIDYRITQHQGTTVTIQTGDYYQYRIEAEHLDKIGVKPKTTLEYNIELTDDQDTNINLINQAITKTLQTIYDPEIPVNIHELGLVMKQETSHIPGGKKHDYQTHIEITLTMPGCGMGDILTNEIQEKVLKIPGIKAATVSLCWDQVWTPEHMSEAARLQLGLL